MSFVTIYLIGSLITGGVIYNNCDYENSRVLSKQDCVLSSTVMGIVWPLPLGLYTYSKFNEKKDELKK